jgi:ElaA protein
MNIAIKKFKDIEVDELYKLLQLRSAVFVVEQDCVYQDLDGRDEMALHVIGTKKSEVVAYTRIFRAGDYFDRAGIGRVAVKADQRRFGYGRKIMIASVKAIEEFFAETTAQLSAQTYLKGFYNSLGFIETGEEYLEDGIPHIMMVKK